MITADVDEAGTESPTAISVGASDETLTVPTSAVHVDGAATTVDVLADGLVSAVPVTTGSVGTELTEVTAGLSEGDVVVLADLRRDIVDGADQSDSGLTGLSGASGTAVSDVTGPGGMPPGGAVPAPPSGG